MILLSPSEGETTNKAWALAYAAIGWSVFPVYEITGAGECACADGAECARPGKHPRTPGGVNDATRDRARIEAWWGRAPEASLGIATGAASGLTVVDADAGEGKPGVLNLTILVGPNGGMPRTITARTGGGGLHLYFKHEPRLPTGQNTLAEAIDVRSDGGYVIAPPSRHFSGGEYAWTSGAGELLAVPEWMCEPRARARPRGRPRKHSPFSLEKLASMLSVIEPDDRERWLRAGVIIGRMYAGTPLEAEAWTLYEEWAARSSKFIEDRAGNLARMREMFYERALAEPRAGGEELSIGSIISWAREGGWTPFGDKTAIAFEPGNEIAMAEGLVSTLLGEDLRHFNVMGEVRDVLRTTLPLVRNLQSAALNGHAAAETLLVRKTTSVGLLGAIARRAVLKVTSAEGIARAITIPISLAQLALAELSGMLPTLTGLAGWPMMGADGSLLLRPRGYDAATGLYFDIDDSLVIQSLNPTDARAVIFEDLFCDFPFDDELSRAGALGMMLGFMQRPLMKTCPAFAVVAPQPGSGKSTLVEVASLAVHGTAIAAHSWSLESEELRKALHSLIIAKYPAVLFDNIGRGVAVTSDHLAKFLTSEISADRTLGSSTTQKEVNSLLITFTGNNISFIRDLASRTITLKLNAKVGDPLRRRFKHRDVRAYAIENRARWLSALIAIARAGVGFGMPGAPSRFEDFDLMVAAPVLAVTGLDIRELLRGESEGDADEDETTRAMLELLWRWQEKWRGGENGEPWKTSDAATAIENHTIDDVAAKVVARGCGNAKLFDANPAHALGLALRMLNGNYSFAPILLQSRINTHSKTSQWIIKGGPTLSEERENF